jgi:uncharacterized protein (DUF885 family)
VSPAAAFTAWLDRFFAWHFRHRPVDATFVGLHAHDGRLPDLSEAGRGDALAGAESLRSELDALPGEPLGEAESLDRDLARGALAIRRWELGSDHFALGNPCVHTSEAAFGLIGLLRRPFAPPATRLEAAIERIAAIPALLDAAATAIRRAPAAWIERAENECAGLRALLGDGIEAFIRDTEGIGGPRPRMGTGACAEPDGGGVTSVDARTVRRITDQALAAVGRMESRLAEARGTAHHRHACGPEALDLLLRHGHFLEIDASEIERYAWDQVARSEADLRERARALGAATWETALAALADLHPTVGGYYERHRELWEACRRVAEAHRLLTWPDLPVRYLPRPAWVRAAAPHLYFLAYHAPAPLDDLAETEYLVTPIEPDMPPDEQARLLRAANDSVIKLNHVVHHGAIGHHVQNWFAARAESRIGRIAAVDCASRIALLCGGTMAEGWACYATELMAEVGFLTPGEELAAEHTRLRMAARAVADVRLHEGRWTLDEVAAFYRDRAGLTTVAARAEAVKNSLFPGMALIYLTGTDAIHQLRRDLGARPGFSLGRFHDALLAHGSVPVALAAKAMRASWWPATS